MDKDILLSDYQFTDHRFHTLHSAGSDIFFSRPCIGYVKKGYAEFIYRGKTVRACEGDLIYIAYETRYQSIWHGFPDIMWYSVEFDFHSKFSFYDYRFQILKNYPSGLFEKMRQTYETAPMLSVSYFYRLLEDIYQKLERTPTTVAHTTVEPAVKFIESNYRQQISVKTLARLCHISESGFYKLFKKATGVTPVAYKHGIMIQSAIHLLANTSMSIEEISSYVGFPSSNYFRKVFYRLTGKTPKELR